MIVILALLVATAESVVSQCPDMCTSRPCSDGNAFCDGVGLLHPPPGLWPGVTAIWMNSNNISYIKPNFLSGFPNIQKLYVQKNPITEADFNILRTNPNVFVVDFTDSPVQKIIPLHPGIEHSRLSIINLAGTNISSLPEDLLRGLRASYIDLSETPLVLPADRPLLTTNTVQILDLSRTDGRHITNVTFSGITNPILIYLRNARIEDISNVFTSFPINTLYLDYNPIKAVRKGSFAGDGFMRLEMKGALLETLEVEAVDGILRGALVIDDTPLACKCAYEEIYRWANDKGVRLSATCGTRPPCDFEK